MEKWDIDLDLIWQVKLHPELYNAQHIDFQNSEARGAAWMSIAKKLNSTTYLTRRRWSELEKNFGDMIIAKRNDLPHKAALYSRQMLFLAPIVHAEADILAGKISAFTERSIASSSTGPLIDFFISMGRMVEKFDKKTQIEIKDKVFQLVRDAEMPINKTAYFQLWEWLKFFISTFVIFYIFIIFLKLNPTLLSS
uniref:MADF domain-containing protein n=1 Tax=Heliothis virescens TaxID=7102 RepID=A0A2A4J9V4_HELVI